jgi:Bacterial Ig-like domain
MNKNSITVNSQNSGCTGNIQLSADSFQSCVVMSSATFTSDNISFSLITGNNLDYFTNYKLKILSSVKDINDIEMGADYVSETGFTTIDTPDTTAPIIEATTPADGAIDIVYDGSLALKFSEIIDSTSLTVNSLDTSCDKNIQVSTDGFRSCIRMLSSILTSDNKTFTITPSNNLSFYTQYKIRVLSTVKDLAGNTMENIFVMSSGFTTERPIPEVSSTIPADNSSDVAVDGSIVVNFSEEMNTSTITTNISDTACSGNIQVRQGTADSDTCVQMATNPQSSNDDKTFTLILNTDLFHNTPYFIFISSDVRTKYSATPRFDITQDAGFATLPVNVPGNFKAIPNDRLVVLSWDPVADATYTICWDSSSDAGDCNHIISGVASESYTHSDLPNDSTYDYKVKAAINGIEGEYTSELEAAPYLATEAVIYSASRSQGNLALRHQGRCEDYNSLNFKNVKPFISMPGSNIKDIAVPLDAVVKSKTDIQIKDSWANLFPATTIDVTLCEAGVFCSDIYLWWSFSTVDGIYDSLNCYDGTSNGSSDMGARGTYDASDDGWLFEGNRYCERLEYLLCIGW